MTLGPGVGSDDRPLVRAPAPRLLLGKEQVLLFGAGAGSVAVLDGDHASLVLAVLDLAGKATAREDLVTAILDRAGAPASQRAAVDQAVDLLVRWGALVPVRASPAEPPAGAPAVPGAHVVVCVTGAIGAAYAPPLVERLVAAGHAVRVVMTRAARRFVATRTFRAITHRRVTTSLWRGTLDEPAPHVALARWADAVVVYPCTATTLGRLRTGDCSEIVSAVATTTRAPVLLVPSMNTEMLAAPAVAENLEHLRDHGFFVAHPGLGLEVADAPGERAARGGVAAPAGHVLQYVAWLLERALGGGPRVLSRAEWESEHARHAPPGAADAAILAALDRVAPGPSRVLELGTGLGSFARAAATRGHAVVATDLARTAIVRAEAVDPAAKVTWVVDDATDSSLHGTFDVAVDRGCFGCIPVARRGRFAETVAARLRADGALLLVVHRAPAAQIRAFGFTNEEVAQLFLPWFSIDEAIDATLGFGDLAPGPALLFVLRRKA